MGMLVGFGLSATSYVIVLGAIAKVVPAEHTAKAFGLTTAAGSFGMFAVIPGAQSLLANFDWQTAMQVFAMAAALIVLSLHLLTQQTNTPGLPQHRMTTRRCARHWQKHSAILATG